MPPRGVEVNGTVDLSALFQISYGIYAVGSTWQGRHNVQLANTVFQVLSTPPTLAFCLNKANLTCEYVQHSNRAGISVLAEDAPLDLLRRLGFQTGHKTEKLVGLAHRLGPGGTPLLEEHVCAVLELEVRQSIDLGTHLLFIGEITYAEKIGKDRPMTYADYRSKRGRTHRNAPTYVVEAPQGGKEG